jgi:hypothetical protein
VPNLRNRFLRGFLPGTRTVGTNQSEAIGSHKHSFSGELIDITGGEHSHVVNNNVASNLNRQALCGFGYTYSSCKLSLRGYWDKFLLYDYNGKSKPETHRHSFTPSGSIGAEGEETRPLNTAVMFCIKY